MIGVILDGSSIDKEGKREEKENCHSYLWRLLGIEDITDVVRGNGLRL